MIQQHIYSEALRAMLGSSLSFKTWKPTCRYTSTKDSTPTEPEYTKTALSKHFTRDRMDCPITIEEHLAGTLYLSKPTRLVALSFQ